VGDSSLEALMLLLRYVLDMMDVSIKLKESQEKWGEWDAAPRRLMPAVEGCSSEEMRQATERAKKEVGESASAT
jgi:hypothetical protein